MSPTILLNFNTLRSEIHVNNKQTPDHTSEKTQHLHYMDQPFKTLNKADNSCIFWESHDINKMFSVGKMQNSWWLKQVVHIVPTVPERIRHVWVYICMVLLSQWFPKNWQVSGEYRMASKFVLLTKCYKSYHQKNRWNG